MADTANEGQKLTKGESLTSNNGAYTLTLQDDGNLVLAARGEPRWSTQTNGQNVERAEVQKDGNFVLYTPDKPVWHTNTKGRKSVRLVVQDDGNLVLYAANGAAWSTHTESDAPPPPLVEPEEAAPGAFRRKPAARGPTPWSQATRCGPSRSNSSVTATSTRRSPPQAASPTLTTSNRVKSSPFPDLVPHPD